MGNCLSTVLSGKKKREAKLVEEMPRMVLENGQTMDFREYIKASRVGRTSTVSKLVSKAPQIFEANMSDLPACMREVMFSH